MSANQDEPYANDPLLALRGSDKELWADEYVRRLREGCDDTCPPPSES